MRKRITFTNADDLEAVVLAQLGQGVGAICAETGLTRCQVTYRLTKAKQGEKLPRGKGYITTYRDGSSAIAQSVKRVFLGRVRRSTHRRLPPIFRQPEKS